MKKIIFFLMLMVIAVTPPLFAADRGTPAEAKALLQKAAEHYKAVGRAQALQDFTGKKAPWVDRDLYVFCIDSAHMTLANGSFPQYVGSTVDVLKSNDGKPLGQAAWDAVSKGDGTVHYQWYNPVSGKMEPKTSFNQKVDDGVLCGVGVYAQ
jgi:cytochrome c